MKLKVTAGVEVLQSSVTVCDDHSKNARQKGHARQSENQITHTLSVQYVNCAGGKPCGLLPARSNGITFVSAK
jgi:hypothetical protein